MQNTNQIIQSISINAPLEKVFCFHSDLNNISKVFPSFIKTEIEKLEYPFEEGSEAILSFKLFNIIQLPEWKLKLSEYQENSHFTDQEIDNLFEYFTHKHEFIAQEQNKTIVKNTINYSLKKIPLFLSENFIKILLNFKLQKTKEFLEANSE